MESESARKIKTPEQDRPGVFQQRPPVGTAVLVAPMFGQLECWTTRRVEHDFPRKPLCRAPDHHNRGVLFRIMLEETQKAPSRIAPTKINAANTASTLSFIVTSTRHTSITVAQRNLAETAAALKRVDCCSAAKLDARHSYPPRRQVHEIGKHFRAGKKVPPAARKIFVQAHSLNMTVMRQTPLPQK